MYWANNPKLGEEPNMFLVFGCIAFVLAVPYLVAFIKEKYYPAPAARDIELVAPGAGLR